MTRKVQARVGARRKARECALQLLYQLDGVPPMGGTIGLAKALDLFWELVDPEAGQVSEITGYTDHLLQSVFDHLGDIDEAIQRATHHWRLDRMARVDRNLLRLSVCELLYQPDVPGQVVINEAVELAKEFGSEESSSFVNGILDRLRSELKR